MRLRLGEGIGCAWSVSIAHEKREVMLRVGQVT